MYSLVNKDRYQIKTYHALNAVAELGKDDTTGIAAVLREVTSKRAILLGFNLHNNTASRAWVLFYFMEADNVVLGTTVPDFTVSLGASSSSGWDLYYPIEVVNNKGLSVAATTTENGSTGVTTAVTGSVLYKEF